MTKTYYLVLYENGKSKGIINAMPSILKRDDAKLFFQEANPTIYREVKDKNGFIRELKFVVTDKRFFSYKEKDDSEVVFIVCDGDLDS